MINDIARISRAYDLFKDDEISKTIFLCRLLYSVTGDVRHIAEMVARLDLGENRNFLRAMYGKEVHSGPGLVIFGAGSAGFNSFLLCRELGVPVECFCDNDPQKHGSFFCELPVASPVELGGKYAEHPLLVATGVQRHVEEILAQLEGMGFSKERVLLYQTRFSKQYFETFLPQKPDEVFIDGGGLDASDTQAFTEWCDGQYAACHIFEPDPACMEICKKKLAHLAGGNRVFFAPYGLWNSDETLLFTGRGHGGSSIDGGRQTAFGSVGFIYGATPLTVATGEVCSIQGKTLDAHLNGSPATFIKMDIEGAEYNALLGCTDTIRSHYPKIAVSAYHRPEDIITLPLLIDDIAPGYTFRLRHYTFGPQETVLYAMVP